MHVCVSQSVGVFQFHYLIEKRHCMTSRHAPAFFIEHAQTATTMTRSPVWFSLANCLHPWLNNKHLQYFRINLFFVLMCQL